jgi:hypothetical protein
MVPPCRSEGRTLKQWVDGRSAIECAKAWCGNGTPAVPGEITNLLNSHPDTADARITEGTPELKVRFDLICGEPRRADVVALCEQGDERLSLCIEAKVDESFNRLVRDILVDVVDRIAHGERSRLDCRIRQLAAALLPPPATGLPRLGDRHHQPLTGAAGALAHAVSVRCRRTVLVVHEFHTSTWDPVLGVRNSAALDAFVSRMTSGATRQLKVGKMIGPIRVPGSPLFVDPPALYIGRAVRHT